MKARKIVRNRRKMDERGVSPVIGVILMVAATIVIAAVVMGMLGGFSPPRRTYNVIASASENATGWIAVTYQGGPDAAQVDYLNVSIDDDSYYEGNLPSINTSGWGTADGKSDDVKIGCTLVVKGTQGPNNNHVVVSATFLDGSSQVILDTWT